MEPTTDSKQLLAATFSDANGREYLARLSYIKLRAIKKQTGLDLGDLVHLGRSWAMLLLDDMKALDAIWIAISDDGIIAGLNQDEWLSAMDGTVLEEGRQALSDAIENFTPPHRRKMLQEAMGAVRRGYLEMIQDAEKKIRTSTAEAIKSAKSHVRRGTPRPSAKAS